MLHLRSLKIKTNLLAITGKECITSTGAFVGIKMLTSYLQSLQLNVNKFQHMHIQIANRLYYYTSNKAFPKLPTQSPNYTAPHCCCGPNNRHLGLQRSPTDTAQHMR